MFDSYNITVQDLDAIYDKHKKEMDKLHEFKVTKMVSIVMLKLKDAASAGQRQIKFTEFLPAESIRVLKEKGLNIVDKSDDLYNHYAIWF